jgi:hypothetical protein
MENDQKKSRRRRKRKTDEKDFNQEYPLLPNQVMPQLVRPLLSYSCVAKTAQPVTLADLARLGEVEITSW